LRRRRQTGIWKEAISMKPTKNVGLNVGQGA
jgi:hypothetical protein